ncbi:ricin B-like lectin R40G3 [Phalaenopsis equestris]|uniref:ricin B-like lectin R40G3 n=1 Tax=Phalaenopsis equestris TaxID=78828 RepID=UPI0009E330B8|nr:ricin B-like lectin R40G3 [Phalaenopsis equestris]
MEFPFGHNHHHHEHHTPPPPPHPRRDDDEDERNRFPPHFPFPADGPEPFEPPPGVHHVFHQPGAGFAPPPTFSEPPPPPFFDGPPPPRPSPFVDDPFHDSRHERPYGREEGHHRSGYSDHASHEGEGGSLNRQPTVRVFTKAEENYSLSIRDGKVILARQDPSDEYQHWIKDLRYSTKVKDEESFPAFVLINKATGEAIKHSFGATHPVQLVPYNPNFLDESVLWTESRDLGDGFRCIRMVNNISLNFDAFNGDEQHGGVHDGTIIVLWEWLKGKNQRWKIVPY